MDARHALPYFRNGGMVGRMKTTLIIDDTVMQRLREMAARQGRTISELVEAALRRMLDERPTDARTLPELPSWDSQGATVDIADRDALHDTMGEG